MTTKVSWRTATAASRQGLRFRRNYVRHLNHFKERAEAGFGDSLKSTHRLWERLGFPTIREFEIAFTRLQPKLKEKEAIKPHDRLVSVR
jgi:hypothetical protein